MSNDGNNDTVLVRWNFDFCTWEFLASEFNEGSLHLDKARRFTFDDAVALLQYVNANNCGNHWSISSLEQARVLWAQS